MLFMKPAGEARAAYLYTKQGRQSDVIAYLNEQLSHALVAWPSAAVLAAGLLGPPPFAPNAADRIADVIAVPRGGYALLNTRAEDAARAMSWRGRHGGLSTAEMSVPWLGFRLDKA
jgi:hypothetical protein